MVIKQMKGLAALAMKVGAAVGVDGLNFRKSRINFQLLIDRSCNNVQCFLSNTIQN